MVAQAACPCTAKMRGNGILCRGDAVRRPGATGLGAGAGRGGASPLRKHRRKMRAAPSARRYNAEYALGRTTTMKCSTDRILTTHAGSLSRPADLIALGRARAAGEG